MSNSTSPLTSAITSRRKFLKMAGITTGGLCISIALPAQALAEKGIPLGNDSTELNAFIHLDDNGDTTIYCGRCEMGQGISTDLPYAVADEMEADWARVTVQQGDADEKFGPQSTGGSKSIRVMYKPMREAGAKAKFMLIAAAAKVSQRCTGAASLSSGSDSVPK
jgi:isoquinoline 1-oxidoreductase beta subunit